MSAPTPQQSLAIRSTGDVLVMAGAGAGKTSTLVSRILDRALDAQPRTPVDRMLVVTFNEAAAAEMRHRLALALEVRLRAEPEDAWIAEQRALLDTAYVSTLHAFCLRLVREHFHDLELDPQFTVQDEVQNRVQRTAVLRDLLRKHLDQSTPQNAHIRTFLTRHARENIDALHARILEVHDYARSLPEPQPWIDAQLAAYRSESPELWRIQAGPGIAQWASGWLDHVRRLIAIDPENPPARGCAAALEALVRLSPHPGSVPPDIATLSSHLVRLVAAGDKSSLEKRKAAGWLKPLKKLLEEARVVHELLAPGTSESEPSALVQDWHACRHDVVALLELVREFDRAFTQARRAAAVVDFADLEQLALQLLWDPVARQPTRLAHLWQGVFDFVCVDEYQDINGAQDRILQCVSREGDRANRFLVGDIKQSIYRFRRADPRIFQNYARLWRTGDHHTVAPLTENFRSHQAVLHFVNALFRLIMRPEVGGVAYDTEAELQVGAPEARPYFREQAEGRIELHLLLTGLTAPDAETGTTAATPAGADISPTEDAPESGGETDDLDIEETQARLTARRLRDLHDAGCPIWDSTIRSTRPARWRDMVVLHPAPRSVSERWARAFAAEGVPLDARRGGFFEALEVSDLIHLVRLLDNPRQDLPLLAVLHSPLVGMTVEELAMIRITSPSLTLWPALVALAGVFQIDPKTIAATGSHPAPAPPADPELRSVLATARAKAGQFLEAHARWRRIATQGSLAACLETVLAETGYEAWILGQERADAKRANLHRLLALSRQFDDFQRHGLFRFIQFLEAQSDAADRMESAPAASGDSVRLLSMHQSKGLEFPVVVAAGLGRRFNDEDLKRDWLLDSDYGICPPVIPQDRPGRYHSLPRWLAGHRQRRDLIGEQIRLLYVACTRAAERLLLVGTTRESRLTTWAECQGTLTLRALLEAQSPLDWIGPLLPSLAGVENLDLRESGRSERLLWNVWRSVPPPLPGPPVSPPQPTSNPNPPTSAIPTPGQLTFDLSSGTAALLSPSLEAGRRLGWQYPWPTATREPAKAAVTALRRQWLADDETAPTPAASPAVPREPTTSTTSGTHPTPGASRPSAIERGLTHHLFNEHVDLSCTQTLDALRSEALRLEGMGWLSPEDAASLDLDGIAGFWASPVADALRKHADCVQRELPFTTRLRIAEARRLGSSQSPSGFAPDDYQVVQGVIDLALILPDEIWIVDFKTDRVSPDTVALRAQEYGPQLRIYAHALTEIYRRPVTRSWLYFLATRDLVPIGDG